MFASFTVTFQLPHQHRFDSESPNEVSWAQAKVEQLFNHTERVIFEDMSELDKMRQAPSNYWTTHTLSSSTARERSFSALVALLATKRIAK